MPSSEGLLDLMGQMGSVVAGAFARMEIAEKEIDKAKDRHPWKADLVDGAFRKLQPTNLLREASDEVYGLHCAELLDRAAEGVSLVAPTRAEKMMMLRHLALKSPLTEATAALYWRIFREVFPAVTVRGLEGWEPRESYPGELDELDVVVTRTIVNGESLKELRG